MTRSGCAIMRHVVYRRFRELTLFNLCLTARILASFRTLIWRSRVALYYRLGRYAKSAVGMVCTGFCDEAQILYSLSFTKSRVATFLSTFLFFSIALTFAYWFSLYLCIPFFHFSFFFSCFTFFLIPSYVPFLSPCIHLLNLRMCCIASNDIREGPPWIISNVMTAWSSIYCTTQNGSGGEIFGRISWSSWRQAVCRYASLWRGSNCLRCTIWSGVWHCCECWDETLVTLQRSLQVRTGLLFL